MLCRRGFSVIMTFARSNLKKIGRNTVDESVFLINPSAPKSAQISSEWLRFSQPCGTGQGRRRVQTVSCGHVQRAWQRSKKPQIQEAQCPHRLDAVLWTAHPPAESLPASYRSPHFLLKEVPQYLAAARMAQLPQCLCFDLADAFARHAEALPNLFEGA